MLFANVEIIRFSHERARDYAVNHLKNPFLQPPAVKCVAVIVVEIKFMRIFHVLTTRRVRAVVSWGKNNKPEGK